MRGRASHLQLHAKPRLALLLASLLAPAIAWPDAGDKIEIGAVDIESLLDLSVEAVTRRTERSSDAPAAVFVIRADDIRRNGYRTLAEVLGSVPGLFAYPGGTFSQVGVRGMGVLGDSTTRLLVLVDGHPLANSLGIDLGRGLPVPLAAIQRVEVIKGPAGSVYGPAAFFGVVNLVTADASPHAELWAGAELAQGSVPGREASARWSVRGDEVEASFSGDAYSTRGLDRTYPELAAIPGAPAGGEVSGLSYADSGTGHARLRWRDLDASAACGHSFSGIPTTGAYFDRRTAIEGLTCFATAGWRRELGETLTVTSRASYDHLDLRAALGNPPPPAGFGLYRHEGYDRWVTGELRGDWRASSTLRVDVGATVQVHATLERSHGELLPSLEGGMARRFGAVNGWLTGELRPLRTLALHGGITIYEHSLFGHRLTPKAAAVWRPTRADAVKAMWSTGFRPPTMTEAFLQDQLLFAANPELKPETVSSSELLYERRLGDVASVSASVFWNEYRDLIRFVGVPAPGLGRAPDPDVPSDFRRMAQNARPLRVVGGELGARLGWGDLLQGYGGVSTQRVDEAFRPNFPTVTGNVSLSTRALWRPLLVSVRGTASSALEKPRQTAGGSPDVPAALSLGALAALDVPGLRGVQVELSATNLLDARNASPAHAEVAPVTALPEASRTVRASVRGRLW